VETPTICPACGAAWDDGRNCTDHFHQMGAWELEHQLYDVHHLMVLCFYLQHPALYSPEGLAFAQTLLVEFVEDGVTPQAMRQRIGRGIDSGVRDVKIKGTPEAHGSYARPVAWSMRAGDVTAAGIEHYYASVRQWAASTLQALRESGNLDVRAEPDRLVTRHFFS
jgi:hypothetical protein